MSCVVTMFTCQFGALLLVKSYLLLLIRERNDKFQVGLYKEENDQKLLADHVLMEISSLCYHFLKKSKTNNLNAVITGKRQREVGLVAPAKCSFENVDKKCADILERSTSKLKRTAPYSCVNPSCAKEGGEGGLG